MITYQMVGTVSSPRTEPFEARQRILEEATRLFAAQGFDGTSIQQIADAVGLRKPSLLYHFPSKEELRLGVLEQVLGHWNEVMPRVLLAASSSDGQFDGVLEEMIGFFSADPDRARLLLREALDRPAVMRALMRRHVAPWIDVVADFIRKGQARGGLRSDVDPEAYASQVIVLLIGSIAAHQALGVTDRERSLAELVRISRSSLFLPLTGPPSDREELPAWPTS